MSYFRIIEDCSPYYIRFTHDKLDELVEYCKTCIPTDFDQLPEFTHLRLTPDQSEQVLAMTPVSTLFELEKRRVSFFISKPGLYYRAHKDGVNTRFSINYGIVINDSKCITSWYSDQDLSRYSTDILTSTASRECAGFDKTKHTPIKTMTAKANECILFNTDIFHDWDNSQSAENRIVLTLRLTPYSIGHVYFDDAKKLILDHAIKDN